MTFPDEESAEEFEDYAEFLKSEFPRFGPFQRVNVPGRGVMQGWQYREYLVKQLKDLIAELGGEGAVSGEYDQEAEPEPDAPQIQMPRLQNADAGKALREAAEKRADAIRQSNKRIEDAFRGLE
jgi:hypothetical protein